MRKSLICPADCLSGVEKKANDVADTLWGGEIEHMFHRVERL
jgi:hypothetical protein